MTGSDVHQFDQLLLDLWRESSRHVEIGAAVEEIAPALFGDLPVDIVLIRRIELERAALETVAVGVCQLGPLPKKTHSECEPAQLDVLVRWCRDGSLLHGRADADDLLTRTIVPAGTVGEVLAGPLNAADRPVGVVILTARAPRKFEPRHQELLKQLLEPFTVWIENDRRLHELTALREAAEADNRTLLARLGRHDISASIVGSDTGLKPVMDRVDPL